MQRLRFADAIQARTQGAELLGARHERRFTLEDHDVRIGPPFFARAFSPQDVEFNGIRNSLHGSLGEIEAWHYRKGNPTRRSMRRVDYAALHRAVRASVAGGNRLAGRPFLFRSFEC